MTRNYYTTSSYYIDHATYGGELSLSDFCGKNTLSNMARKISDEIRFDEMCRQNIENRERNKNYKLEGKNAEIKVWKI